MEKTEPKDTITKEAESVLTKYVDAFTSKPEEKFNKYKEFTLGVYKIIGIEKPEETWEMFYGAEDDDKQFVRDMETHCHIDFGSGSSNYRVYINKSDDGKIEISYPEPLEGSDAYKFWKNFINNFRSSRVDLLQKVE